MGDRVIFYAEEGKITNNTPSPASAGCSPQSAIATVPTVYS